MDNVCPVKIRSKYSSNTLLCLLRIFTGQTLAQNPENVYHVAPLHLAAKNGHYEICQLILDNLIDVEDETNLVAKDDQTYHDSPFLLALEGGHLNLCELFSS